MPLDLIWVVVILFIISEAQRNKGKHSFLLKQHNKLTTKYFL
jgi:hypothetical protein